MVIQKDMLKLLNEVSKLFNNSPYNQIYSILNIISTVTGCRNVRFYIKENGMYTCYAAIPKADEKKLLGLRIPELTYIRLIKERETPTIVASDFDRRDIVKDMLGQKWFALIPVRMESGSGFIAIDDKDTQLNDDINRELKTLNQLVNECFYNAEAKKILHQMSITDRLTGLYNRVYFDEKFFEFIHDLSANGEPFYLTLLDIDGLKKINDTYGHTVGDQLITGFSTALKHVLHSIRGDFTLVRFGGDEFVVMNKGNIGDAEKLAALLKSKLSKRSIRVHTDANTLVTIQLNFSIGYVESPIIRGLESKRILYDKELCKGYMMEMLTHADRNMYKDKRRNKENQKKNLNQLRQTF